MRTLNDLKLCKKSRKIVEDWLTEWLDMFIKQANGRTGWPYRADFEKDDFFFFTDCKDILSKDPEAKGQEANPAIRERKRKVFFVLLMKTLLGHKNICDVITCGHCGYNPCWIDSLGDGNGHWVYCPKCFKTDIHVFPAGYDNCVKIIRRKVAQKRFPIPSRALKDKIAADMEIEIKLDEKRKVPRGAWSTIIKGNDKPETKIFKDALERSKKYFSRNKK